VALHHGQAEPRGLIILHNCFYDVDDDNGPPAKMKNGHDIHYDLAGADSALRDQLGGVGDLRA
jgi:hypothetical protein